jgi:hypothetical protein
MINKRGLELRPTAESLLLDNRQMNFALLQSAQCMTQKSANGYSNSPNYVAGRLQLDTWLASATSTLSARNPLKKLNFGALNKISDNCIFSLSSMNVNE